MQADGYSLDDKRTLLNGTGPNKHASNNTLDILARWQNRSAETDRQRSDQSFMAPKAEIVGNDYDLSINRYKQIVYAEMQYDAPLLILDELARLEVEIQAGMAELRRMLVMNWGLRARGGCRSTAARRIHSASGTSCKVIVFIHHIPLHHVSFYT